jgi:hypothetical protein
MKAKRKRFDGMGESRKWKEAVAEEINGMTPQKTMAHFDRTTYTNGGTLDNNVVPTWCTAQDTVSIRTKRQYGCTEG